MDGNINDEKLNFLLNNTKYSFEEIFVIDKYIKFAQRTNMKFSGGGSVMGFHVNSQRLDITNNEKSEYPDLKFYINAGDDSYKFAYYFQRKCMNENLNFYYKVVNPFINVVARLDKMCVFTTYKNAEKILSIIKKVKEEHPELRYEKPPMMAGLIDGWIGIGQDYLIEDTSFNQSMAEISYNALYETFKNDSKDEVLTAIKNRDKGKMLTLINELYKEASKENIDIDKMCLTKQAKKELLNNRFGTL